MKTTTLGNGGPKVSVLGFGSMNMAMQMPRHDKECIATIQGDS